MQKMKNTENQAFDDQLFLEVFHFTVKRSPQQCYQLNYNFQGIDISLQTCKRICGAALIHAKILHSDAFKPIGKMPINI